jgi:hypothetical protein
MWWILMGLVVLALLVWADRRTRGRGTKDSGGAADHATGKYI